MCVECFIGVIIFDVSGMFLVVLVIVVESTKKQWEKGRKSEKEKEN